MKKLRAWLPKAHPIFFVLYAASAAFMTYFCMYAFRKPYTVGTYESITVDSVGLDFKIALIISQILGYTVAKFIGVKVISEMTQSRRRLAIISMISSAWLALILFAIIPAPFNIACLFLNGLSLGMIWGVVFSYIEGRRTTEILGAILAITFIVASGWVRTVGRWLLLEFQVPELWMPALTGSIFVIPLFISVYFLSQLPPPNKDDERERKKRQPMNAKQRWQFFFAFAPGLTLLIASFVLFTGFRDFRDNFSAELWSALGYGDEPTIFAYAGIRIAFFVLIALGAMVMIRNNRVAFLVNHLFILAGSALMIASTWGFQQQMIDAKSWMILLGAGLYTAYIPYNCFLFDRMIAVVGVAANAGFLMYLANSIGYLGGTGILFYRVFGEPNLSWINFFIKASYFVGFSAGAMVIGSLIYFLVRLKESNVNNLSLQAAY